jgi:hypothetical protein
MRTGAAVSFGADTVVLGADLLAFFFEAALAGAATSFGLADLWLSGLPVVTFVSVGWDLEDFAPADFVLTDFGLAAGPLAVFALADLPVGEAVRAFFLFLAGSSAAADFFATAFFGGALALAFFEAPFCAPLAVCVACDLAMFASHQVFKLSAG